MAKKTASVSMMTLLFAGCAVTRHETRPALRGEASSLAALEASLAAPGPIELTTVVAADWQVEREGLINLEHPRARHLEPGREDIQIFFHALRHPRHGLFLIDTGVAASIKDERRSPLSWPLTSAFDVAALKVHVTTGRWLRERQQPLRGVFVTHLHLDHILGLPDIAADVPIYTGPGEAEAKSFAHLFVQGTNDRLLRERAPLRTWGFTSGEGGAVLDVFGDASVFAVHVPGHTPGSTAFVVRTPMGPVLIVGDACHTRFGWDNEVEPGTFSHDQPQSAASLRWLRRLVQRHPQMTVRLGHQAVQALASGAAGGSLGSASATRSTR